MTGGLVIGVRFDGSDITDLAPLSKLTSVGGPLYVIHNEALTSLDELANLTSVGEDFFIISNAALTSLDGLANLTYIGTSLRIANNDALVSLDGLGNLSSVDANLIVFANDALHQCSCGLAGLISGDPPDFSGVEGSVTISINDSGGQCNTPQQVLEDVCPTTSVDPTGPALPTEIALAPAYPNPFANETLIGFALPEATAIRLVVYDVLGREVAVLVDRQVEAGRHEVVLDGTDLPSETYLVRLETGARTETQPLSVVR